MPRSRVLVTGADGRIGRQAVRTLVDHGYAVTGLSVGWEHESPADRLITGDATESDDVARALADVDAVVHLAAIPHPDFAPPYEVYRTNTAATFNVLSQAGERGIRRAVVASSINAFGVPMNQHDVLPAYFPIDEDIDVRLDDWYSLSKASDELTCQMAASRWDMDIVALRFPYVGTEQEIRAQSAAVSADPGNWVRLGFGYLDVRDAALAVVAALRAPIRGAHIIGLAAEDTLLDVESADLLDLHAPEVPRRQVITGRAALIDTTRARTVLGFTPRHSVHH